MKKREQEEEDGAVAGGEGRQWRGDERGEDEREERREAKEMERRSQKWSGQKTHEGSLTAVKQFPERI